MAIIVADVTNHRKSAPELDVASTLLREESGKTIPVGEWVPVFNRGCKRVVLVGGTSPVTLVKVRGAVYEGAGHRVDEVRVSGTRCPIHTLKKINRSGNKTIVDIVFALDPSNTVKIGENSEAYMDIRFPTGFSPMCYVSKGSDFQYLAAVFDPLGLVAIDITPVSFCLLWGSREECTVSISKVLGDEVVTTLSGQTHKLEVENMEPGTPYNIKVCDSRDSFCLRVDTAEMDVAGMSRYVTSRTDEHGTIDLSILDPVHVRYLRENGILGTGQTVRVKGELDTEKYLYEARVVTTGDTVDIEDVSGTPKNVYIVPDFTDVSGTNQYICFNDAGTNHIVQFDRTESFVRYMDRDYLHGSSFVVSNRLVQVAKGSIILVIGDDVPAEFPGGDVTAAQVLSSGDVIVKDLIMRTSSQVVNKVDGSTTYGLSSYYVYDSSSGTTLECARISHGLNDTKDTGSVKFSVLYTDGLGDQSLIDTVTTDPAETSIRSKTDTADLTATFGTGGLHFNTDEGDIYFGEDKDFRIHFQEASGLDPAMLQIQSLNGSTYVTRFLVTSEPP